MCESQDWNRNQGDSPGLDQRPFQGVGEVIHMKLVGEEKGKQSKYEQHEMRNPSPTQETLKLSFLILIPRRAIIQPASNAVPATRYPHQKK